MDTAKEESGRNPASKHQMQPECGESAAGRPNLSRQTKFFGANGDGEKNIYPS